MDWSTLLITFAAILMLIEQLCVYLFLDYPYSLGIPVSNLRVDPNAYQLILSQVSEIGILNTVTLEYSLREPSSEIYIRRANYPYFRGAWLFCANLKPFSPLTISIRVNLFSMIFMVFLLYGFLIIPRGPLILLILLPATSAYVVHSYILLYRALVDKLVDPTQSDL